MGWLEDQLDADFAHWRDQLAEDEVESLLYYQGGAHEIINAFFRDRDAISDQLSDKHYEVVEEVTRRIDAVLERGRLTREVRCYRGLSSYHDLFGLREPSAIIGTPFEELAYCSTSTDIHRALRFVGRTGFLLAFEVPIGTGAAWMPSLEHETYAVQRELLLERGLRFRVEDVWRDSDTLVVEAVLE